MPAPAIGKLQWPITIAKRTQAPDPAGAGVVDTLESQQTVRADIQPVGALTFYSGAQVETPITHLVTIRFLDWLDTNHVITRVLRRQDGSTRTELFRIRRLKWLDGDNRFLQLEVEQETEE